MLRRKRNKSALTNLENSGGPGKLMHFPPHRPYPNTSQALQHPNAGEDSVGSLIKGSVRAGDDPALRLFRLDHQNCGCPSYGFSHQVCKKPTDTESRGVFPVCAERVLDPQSQHTCSASTCFHTPQTLEQQHSPAFIGSGFSCLHLKAQYPFILPPML